MESRHAPSGSRRAAIVAAVVFGVALAVGSGASAGVLAQSSPRGGRPSLGTRSLPGPPLLRTPSVAKLLPPLPHIKLPPVTVSVPPLRKLLPAPRKAPSPSSGKPTRSPGGGPRPSHGG